MKNFLYFFLILAFVAACSSEDTAEQPSNSEKPSTQQETNPSNEEEDTSETNNDSDNAMTIEHSTSFILNLIDEMDQWDTYGAYISYKENYNNEEMPYFNYLRRLEYNKNTPEVFIDTHFENGYYDQIRLYGKQDTVYESFNNEPFQQSEAKEILRNAIENRKDFFQFVLDVSLGGVHEETDDGVIHRITIPPSAYEELAKFTALITGDNLEGTLDTKFNYKEAIFDFYITGTDVTGYSLSLQFTEDDIDGLIDITILESFDAINNLEEITNPMN